jgi:hypothetical protein
MKYPGSLEAESAVARTYAPWKKDRCFVWSHRSRPEKDMLCGREKKDQKKTTVALEAKALGGDGAGLPAALVAVTATLRKMANLYCFTQLQLQLTFFCSCKLK